MNENLTLEDILNDVISDPVLNQILVKYWSFVIGMETANKLNKLVAHEQVAIDKNITIHSRGDNLDNRVKPDIA